MVQVSEKTMIQPCEAERQGKQYEIPAPFEIPGNQVLTWGNPWVSVRINGVAIQIPRGKVEVVEITTYEANGKEFNIISDTWR